MSLGDAIRRLRGVEPRPAHFAYSRWDGARSGFDLDAEGLFEEISDDLLYHGDIASALRRLMTQGFHDREGRRVTGLRDLLERLRERRREALARGDPEGVFGEVDDALRNVVRTERDALDSLGTRAREARAEGAERSADLRSETAALKNAELDMLPDDLVGRIKALERYDFESDDARREYEALAERLREQVLQRLLDRMAGLADAAGAETSQADEADGAAAARELQRIKGMLAELNEMLAARQREEEPDFAGFMARHGDFFPENPANLDELLEILARRLAAAGAMLNSMTPAQRDQLEQLSEKFLADMDLDWQLSELANRLREQFPEIGWERRYEFTGADPLDFASAMDLMSELGRIDEIERLLSDAISPGALAGADLDEVRRLLGDEAADSIAALAELAETLAHQGLAERRGERLELTPRALRRIGQGALRDLFSNLSAGTLGRHAVHRCGPGHERESDTKPYAFGDPFNLDIARTVRNAVTRGGGVPVKLLPEDFEVQRTELDVSSATVLMVDLSLSMPMRGNFLPAKKVAMALQALISSQFPRDYLGLVSFSNVAREFAPVKLPEISWDYVYGTNMHHGLMLARRMLKGRSGAKQVVMITDGEPTAHLTASGREFFSYPPTRATIEVTLAEVARCTREGIRINTFMLDASPNLADFVERVSRINGGRAFFTTNQNLGDYLLMDFVEHKRSLLRASR